MSFVLILYSPRLSAGPVSHLAEVYPLGVFLGHPSSSSVVLHAVEGTETADRGRRFSTVVVSLHLY